MGAISALLTAIFTGIVAITAIGGIYFAWYQIRSHRRSQNEAIALGIYREYLLRAIQYPEVSYPTKQPITEETEIRHEWFITYLLYAADEILDLFPDDDGWRHTLKTELEYHAFYYDKREYHEDMESYRPRLLELIDEIVHESKLRK